MTKKIVFEIDDEVNEKLRRYIAKKYPLESYGKVKQIINDALKEYLDKQET